MAAQFSGSRPA
ncbi:putative Holliday junction resolvase, partial [Yersinia pestis PY-10]